MSLYNQSAWASSPIQSGGGGRTHMVVLSWWMQYIHAVWNGQLLTFGFPRTSSAPHQPSAGFVFPTDLHISMHCLQQ